MTDQTASRYVKVPKGYPNAGRNGRVIAETADTVDVQVNTYCRTTMRGHRSAVVSVNRSDLPAVPA